ncbi:hypothetical protein E4U09_000764 [Claviceps aff. purpurea]|uniref:MFS transporter n=1 Tax=Claviceps aff. purpurea TaxID=1967640 RepID=A0A9P7QKC5_9HYPO|nr:hypothetical protein E4U09_000764 [Claviceps aff. purpurea]
MMRSWSNWRIGPAFFLWIAHAGDQPDSVFGLRGIEHLERWRTAPQLLGPPQTNVPSSAQHLTTMVTMAQIHLLVALLASLFALTSAAYAPVFCKCTCFKNSTIIPLGPKSQQPQSDSSSHALLSRFFSSDSLPLFATPLLSARPKPADSLVRGTDDDDDDDDDTRSRSNNVSPRSLSTSCSECTKSFCLNQGIDFCKEAKEEDVVTMCFQRDSNKDRIIVWGFILGTTGLLGWAALKRFIEQRDQRAAALSRGSISYVPVGQ